MGAGFLKSCLLAILTATCCIPQAKTGPGKMMKQESMVGATEKCIPCDSNRRWKWGKLSFSLLQGFVELSPNHLFEHLEKKYLFPLYL